MSPEGQLRFSSFDLVWGMTIILIDRLRKLDQAEGLSSAERAQSVAYKLAAGQLSLMIEKDRAGSLTDEDFLQLEAVIQKAGAATEAGAPILELLGGIPRP